MCDGRRREEAGRQIRDTESKPRTPHKDVGKKMKKTLTAKWHHSKKAKKKQKTQV